MVRIKANNRVIKDLPVTKIFLLTKNKFVTREKMESVNSPKYALGFTTRLRGHFNTNINSKWLKNL